MDQKIEISTDENGIKLYSTTTESLEFHSKHLDGISRWLTQMDKLKSLSRGISNTIPFNDLKLVLELNGLLNISTLDLAVIVRHFYLSKHKWEQQFYVKHAYTIVYETINTYNKTNKNFQKLLVARATAVLTEFDEVANELKQFKKENMSTIEPIRNRVAAHIEQFNIYYKTINSIDVMKALVVIQSFILILNKLQRISTGLIKIYDAELSNYSTKPNE
ncbi:MAG: hypothetical protein ABI166_01625 [Mucilaginibacter sp.]